MKILKCSKTVFLLRSAKHRVSAVDPVTLISITLNVPGDC